MSNALPTTTVSVPIAGPAGASTSYNFRHDTAADSDWLKQDKSSDKFSSEFKNKTGFVARDVDNLNYDAKAISGQRKALGGNADPAATYAAYKQYQNDLSQMRTDLDGALAAVNKDTDANAVKEKRLLGVESAYTTGLTRNVNSDLDTINMDSSVPSKFGPVGGLDNYLGTSSTPQDEKSVQNLHDKLNVNLAAVGSEGDSIATLPGEADPNAIAHQQDAGNGRWNNPDPNS